MNNMTNTGSLNKINMNNIFNMNNNMNMNMNNNMNMNMNPNMNMINNMNNNMNNMNMYMNNMNMNMNNNMNMNMNPNMYMNNMNMNMNNMNMNNMNMNNMNNMNMNMNNMNNINNQMMMQNFLNFYSKTMALYQMFNQMNQINNSMNRINIVQGGSQNNTKKLGRLPRGNGTDNYDPFMGYKGPKMNLLFETPSGHKTNIACPINIKVYDLLCQYISKVGLGPNVIGNGIYFLYNGRRLGKSFYDSQVDQVFTVGGKVVVIDYGNLIGA